MSDELTTRILIEIRDEMRATRLELGARLDKTNERLVRTNERLDQVVQEQIRHATAIVQLEHGQREVVDQLKRLNERIDNVLTG